MRIIPGILLAALLGLILLGGCSQIEEYFSFGPAYDVVFDADPHLRSDEVMSKGVAIGRIASKDLETGGLLVVKIEIDKKYKEMMRTNVVFVVRDGVLEYAQAGGDGAPLPSGARIVGFADPAAFMAFQAQSLLMDFSGALMDRLREMLEKSPLNQKPAPRQQGKEL
jgi:hypothetical protein